MQLEVSLDSTSLGLHPTYIDKLSQRSFKVVNRSAVPVNFAVRHAPSAGWEQQQSSMKMLQLQAADEELLLPDDITQVRAATCMHPAPLRTHSAVPQAACRMHQRCVNSRNCLTAAALCPAGAARQPRQRLR